MSRCGCADTCTCLINGETGISIDGTGTANNRYRIRFDPRSGDIIGPGLFWNEQEKEISARISGDTGNTLTFGSDNGLYTTGSGDGTGGGGGGAPGGASVANLPSTGIVGGMMGAGYLHVPENLDRSYHRALQLGLDMVHVVVRTLRDGVTVAYTDPDTTRLSDGFYNQQVADTDTQSWAAIPQVSTRYYRPEQDYFDPVTGKEYALDPWAGFFGFQQEPQSGGTFCADVASILGGRTVIAWQVVDSRSMTDLRRIITEYGLTGSSIVMTDQDLSLLDPFAAMGVTTAAVINNPAHLTSLSPTTLQTNSIDWVFISLVGGFAYEDMIAYSEAGLNCIAFPAQYQSEQLMVNQATTFGGYGFRGGLSPDPVYYNGARNGYVYRHQESTWERLTVEYGQYNDYQAMGRMTQSQYRGWRQWKHNHEFYSPIETDWRNQVANSGRGTTGPWWIQQGWACPVQTDMYGSFTVAFWARWLSLAEGYQNWVNLAFGVDEDHPLRTGPTAGYNPPQSACYVVGFEWADFPNSYFDDWRGDNIYTRYEFAMSQRSENAGLMPNTDDGDLAQNAVESCYGVQVDAQAGTVSVIQGTVDRVSGRLLNTVVCYTHPELVHTGPYLYTGKQSRDDTPTSALNLYTALRHFTVQPGVLDMAAMFPWAT